MRAWDTGVVTPGSTSCQEVLSSQVSPSSQMPLIQPQAAITLNQVNPPPFRDTGVKKWSLGHRIWLILYWVWRGVDGWGGQGNPHQNIFLVMHHVWGRLPPKPGHSLMRVWGRKENVKLSLIFPVAGECPSGPLGEL